MFGEHLSTSGLIYNPETHWVTFHGGIDFAYLIKLAQNSDMPPDEQSFFQLMSSTFSNFYDVKEIKRDFEHLAGGLSKVAKELDIDRIGTMHQAGSDSLITMRVFFKLKDLMKKWWNIEDENILEKKFNGLIYGLGQSVNDQMYMEEYR